MRHAGKLTNLSAAMNTTAPTLAAINREKGKDFAIGLTMGWLVYLNDILNLNKPMTEDQIDLCATEVIETYGSLKMSDITYLFRKIINGQYGEFYESLTVQKVLTFFRQYYDDRCSLAELESQRDHADFACRDTFNYSRNLRRLWSGMSSKS